MCRDHNGVRDGEIKGRVVDYLLEMVVRDKGREKQKDEEKEKEREREREREREKQI
jgi:hypothetical protein